MIELDNVQKRFGDQEVLRGVSFRSQKGIHYHAHRKVRSRQISAIETYDRARSARFGTYPDRRIGHNWNADIADQQN